MDNFLTEWVTYVWYHMKKKPGYGLFIHMYVPMYVCMYSCLQIIDANGMGEFTVELPLFQM